MYGLWELGSSELEHGDMGGDKIMTERAEYSVYWWDQEDGQHEESRFILLDLAMHQVKRLTQGPASMLGMVKRVIITDGGDCCVFEWKQGEGITWPTKEQRDEHRESTRDNGE